MWTFSRSSLSKILILSCILTLAYQVDLDVDILSGNIKVEYDDPKLILHLKRDVLTPPPGPGKFIRKLPIELEGGGKPKVFPIVNEILKNKRNGFFVECGPTDGEHDTTTLPLELNQGWSGLIVETDPNATKILMGRKRNAWVAEACISPEKYPIKMDKKNPIICPSPPAPCSPLFITVQCYPLPSFLLALNVSVVDYLSLDIPGDGLLGVMKTIPWDKIRIQVISFKTNNTFVEEQQGYLKSVGYSFLKSLPTPWVNDSFFVLESFIS